MQARGQMVQQEQQQGLTRLGRELVDVIQNQGRFVWKQMVKIVEQTGQGLFVFVGMPGPSSLYHGAQALIEARQSSDERGEQPRWVVLPLFAGKPGHWLRSHGSPFGQQRGLASAS